MALYFSAVIRSLVLSYVKLRRPDFGTSIIRQMSPAPSRIRSVRAADHGIYRGSRCRNQTASQIGQTEIGRAEAPERRPLHAESLGCAQFRRKRSRHPASTPMSVILFVFVGICGLRERIDQYQFPIVSMQQGFLYADSRCVPLFRRSAQRRQSPPPTTVCAAPHRGFGAGFPEPILCSDRSRR